MPRSREQPQNRRRDQRPPWLRARDLVALGVAFAAGCDSAPSTATVQTCLQSACHAQVENIHIGGPALSCTDCHLGDATATDKEASHVTVDVSFNPSTPGKSYLADPSLAELDALPLDVIGFLNPADYRVASVTCGSSASGGTSCHSDIVAPSLLLNRATLAGQLAGGGFIAGAQDKDAAYAVCATTDDLVPGALAEGTVATLPAFPADPPDSVTDPIARAFYPAYEQLCIECHLYSDGPHVPGRYYSSGCAACHMVTTNASRAETRDVTQDVDELGHVQSHRFTNLVPDSQCAHCHISHLGRSLLARGVRERSEPAGDEAIGGPNRGVEDPVEAVPWAEEFYERYQGNLEIYGKPYPYFLEDENGTVEGDETPPDVHTAAGLGCIDCHNIREAHGDGAMSSRLDGELDVRCQSCHGRPGEVAKLRSDDGLAFNRAETTPGARGNNEPVFQTEGDTVLQYGRFTRILHNVTQITNRTDPAGEGYNARTRTGCQLHAGTAEVREALKAEVNALATSDPELQAETFPGLPAGFTFSTPAEETDGRLECFTCHNAWTPNCYGCHMVRDDRQTCRSALTGETRAGAVASYGLSVVADSLALGFNARGKISPMVGTSIFFTHIDASGATVIDAVPLTDGAGNSGAGNVHNPVQHHTVQKTPRDCTGCHPSAEGETDEAAIATAVGLGSGRYTFLDGLGVTHWLDQLVWADYDGDGQADDPAGRGLPTQLYAVTPLASTTHQARPDALVEPGPLDLETINRTLGARVLPQRE